MHANKTTRLAFICETKKKTTTTTKEKEKGEREIADDCLEKRLIKIALQRH